MPYLGSFGPKFEETIIIFEISTFKFVELQSFVQTVKSLNLGPKIPYLDIFRLKFVETIVTFEISTFEFVKMQSFMEKKIKFGTKLPYFGFLIEI